MSGPRTVLFLCTGNYFRSRFLEEMFNHWARRLDLPWQAQSRGLMRDMAALKAQNVGRISPHTLHALAIRGVRCQSGGRWPQPVQCEDFAQAHRVIAVKEVEHRPMMEKHFPDLVARVEFWAIDDIDVASPEVGVKQAEQRLLHLIQEIRRG